MPMVQVTLIEEASAPKEKIVTKRTDALVSIEKHNRSVLGLGRYRRRS